MPAAFFVSPFSCCLFSEMQKCWAAPSSDLHAKECQLNHGGVGCLAPWDVFSFQLYHVRTKELKISFIKEENKLA